MGSGKRDRLIAFSVNQGSADDFGGAIEGWQDVAQKEWAEKRDVSDGERWSAGEVAAQVTTRFVVLSNTNTRAITPKDRITLDGVTYEIFGIKEIGRRRRLEITAGAQQ